MKSPKNVRKRSPYLRNNFGKTSEIFGKWSEIFGKSSNTSSLVCLCNKQNITCPLVDMNFVFSCSTRHLTRSLRSLVRYRVEHSKIKFISTRGHVISSISSRHLVISSLYNIYELWGFPAIGAPLMMMYRYTAPSLVVNLRVAQKHGWAKTMSKYKSVQRHKA